VFCRCMQVEYECLGEMTTTDLVPDGGNVPVTAANREQYVQLFVQVGRLSLHELALSHDASTVAARRQHFEAVQCVCKRLFQCLRGARTRTIQASRARTSDLWFADSGLPRARGCCNFGRRVRTFVDFFDCFADFYCSYFKGHPTIRLLWQVLHSFNLEQKKKFLFFCTGSDRSPIKGLGSMVFVISRNGPDSERLPTRWAVVLLFSILVFTRLFWANHSLMQPYVFQSLASPRIFHSI
jgi:ubiquitin-protein ligase E3 A